MARKEPEPETSLADFLAEVRSYTSITVEAQIEMLAKWLDEYHPNVAEEIVEEFAA